MKKTATYILAVILSAATLLTAQSVGINADGSMPDASAMLDVKSSNKGFLAPRMTAAQRVAIVSPAAGLLVYQTDSSIGYYYYNGSTWNRFDAGLTDSQWITSGSNVYYNTGNVGIGVTDLSQKLNVNGSVLIPSGESYWIGQASDQGNRLRLHQSGSNSYIDWGEGALTFRSGYSYTSTKAVFTGDGKFGIGTAQPKALLDLGNSISNRKIILYSSADNDHQFYGFGYNDNALRFQLANTAASFEFYSAASTLSSNELFGIKGNGEIVIPAFTTPGVILNSATGVLSSSKGNANQVLKMNSDGTAAEWDNEIVPKGTQAGQMLYWNGTAWVTIPPGLNGQKLKFINGTPTWVD